MITAGDSRFADNKMSNLVDLVGVIEVVNLMRIDLISDAIRKKRNRKGMLLVLLFWPVALADAVGGSTQLLV